MFCTSILTAGHQWAKPNEEVVNALRKAAPKLDVLGTTDVLFWLTDFKHSRPRVMLNAGTLKANAGRFTWFCDAVQPSKELAARYTFGAWLWRAGINGRMSYADAWHPWVLGYETHGSAYPYGHSDWVIDWEHSNSPLIWGSSFAFFLDDPHGKPCPSRDFLNIREGITDYRVLHTLEDAVAAARKAGRPLDDAGAFLRTLRAEIPTDLRQTYEGWGPPDAGGENWYLKPNVRLRPGRLEEIRAEAVRHLVRLKGAHPR